ncbi:MAG: hypothetical protein LUC95_09315, partial [Lachnospiraceae bacterium]|nr:hypothetical protein [Lachnospiraceae bacterium]
ARLLKKSVQWCQNDRYLHQAHYRPYFASFIVEGTYENYRRLREYQSNGLEDRWYAARIADTAAFGGNEWVFEGALQFSSSPVSSLEGKKLVFDNKAVPQRVMKQINDVCRDDVFKLCSVSEIDAAFQACFSRSAVIDTLDTIDIYNVGKGNADYIKGSQCRILYDIGYSYRCYPKKSGNFPYYKATQAIRSLQPTGVVLSHWDLDHIIGTAYARQRIFDVPWIAPSLSNSGKDQASYNAYRLARYVNYFGNLYLVDRAWSALSLPPITSKLGNNYGIFLEMGRGKDPFISRKNCEGLYIIICVNVCKQEKKCLLAGDVPYSCIDDFYWPQGSYLNWGHPNYRQFYGLFDFMHVPHHCSKMDIGAISSGKKQGYECAVISTNRLKKDKTVNNVKRRAGDLNVDPAHYNALKNAYRNVIATIENPAHDDNQNISVQLDLHAGTFTIR